MKYLGGHDPLLRETALIVLTKIKSKKKYFYSRGMINIKQKIFNTMYIAEFTINL